MLAYILIGLVCLFIGGLAVYLCMRAHSEGAIYIVDNNAYLQLNHAPELLTEHQYVTFMVVSRK